MITTYFPLITWGIFWLGWAVWGYTTRQRVQVQQQTDTSWYRRIHVALVVLSFILLLNPLPLLFNKPFAGVPHWVHLVGMGLMLTGMLFGAWARHVLADNWSGAIQQVAKQTLVTRGPYKYIRNPIYTGILSAALGTALYQLSWSSLTGLLILFTIYAVKISREEQFLQHVFVGYPAYSKHTWRLLPFIY
ncbi:methyltransferase family protein [Spirosoma rhododendri]|uniref:Isoprenylcysteine carboxylmethyltransferase family protein n=1 Tax=Spirosoma rhododendri TaxID=2728024 RepID=A0A7L5DPB1_9BACT|nr:isoprenylcysteine carboxylmethyltransferase family protein [Spirosoma rhododendri]QJD79422.1 isoprenylcysteine carboxylmethyltransferase family protein [Spirosoma rhododendri]